MGGWVDESGGRTQRLTRLSNHTCRQAHTSSTPFTNTMADGVFLTSYPRHITGKHVVGAASQPPSNDVSVRAAIPSCPGEVEAL